MGKRENRITVYNSSTVSSKLGVPRDKIIDLCSSGEINAVYNPDVDDYIIPKFELDNFKMKHPEYNNSANFDPMNPVQQPPRRRRGRPPKIKTDEYFASVKEREFPEEEPIIIDEVEEDIDKAPVIEKVSPIMVHSSEIAGLDNNAIIQQIVKNAKSVEITVFKITL